jgi:hypothetical protein
MRDRIALQFHSKLHKAKEQSFTHKCEVYDNQKRKWCKNLLLIETKFG